MWISIKYFTAGRFKHGDALKSLQKVYINWRVVSANLDVFEIIKQNVWYLSEYISESVRSVHNTTINRPEGQSNIGCKNII